MLNYIFCGFIVNFYEKITLRGLNIFLSHFRPLLCSFVGKIEEITTSLVKLLKNMTKDEILFHEPDHIFERFVVFVDISSSFVDDQSFILVGQI